MNNKNILLFYFFLCVLNTNATSIGIKLEQTKNAWFACKKDRLLHLKEDSAVIALIKKKHIMK